MATCLLESQQCTAPGRGGKNIDILHMALDLLLAVVLGSCLCSIEVTILSSMEELSSTVTMNFMVNTSTSKQQVTFNYYWSDPDRKLNYRFQVSISW